MYRFRLWHAVTLLVVASCVGGYVNDRIINYGANDAWPMVAPVSYIAPTPTTAPQMAHSLPSSMMPDEGAPNVCYTHACDDYGNASAASGKATRTYPYLLTETRTDKYGHTYVYTRWVMAPPTKATKTP